jgi:hypothetical protein
LGQVAVNGHAGSLVKNASQMKGRRMHGAGNSLQREAFAQAAREVGFDRFDTLGVISVRAVAARFARQTMPRERCLQHIGDKLKGRRIDPEGFGFAGLQAPHKLMVLPANARCARSGDEGKRPLGTIVESGIEFADDLVEDARRDGENGAAVAAIGWMTDAICRSPREEHRLIDIGNHAAPAEVLGERAVTQEDDIIAIGIFLCRRAAAAGATVVFANPNERTSSEDAIRQWIVEALRHEYRRTLSSNPNQEQQRAILLSPTCSGSC